MTFSDRQAKYHEDSHSRRRRRRLLAPVVLAAVALTAAACGSGSKNSSSSATTAGSSGGSAGSSGSANTASSPSTAPPKPGGSLTVLEELAIAGEWPDGLDPETGPELNTSMMDAIYGSLFEVTTGNKITPDLASGYTLSPDGKTLTIHLRPGEKFSDGTPFNATAVVDNWARDLKDPEDIVPPWPKYTTSTPNSTTIVVHFSSPDGAAVSEMQDSAYSWIASLTAQKKEGEERFKFYPVGAGPFTVVHDTTSAKLVLKKNPLYWQPGHPYLDNLTFLTVSSDETALEDMRAGDGQAYEYMTTPQLVSSFQKAGFKVVLDPPVGILGVQLNSFYKPFNNIKARQAVYYALDVTAFQKVLKDTCPVVQDSLGGPAVLFYEPKVPGYLTYNLAKAKQLVKEVGGISFTMYYQPIGLFQEEATAVQQMLEAAGMKVKLQSDPQISDEVAQYDTGKWAAFFTTGGAYDPAGSDGVALGFSSKSAISGVHDPELDKLINEGAAKVGYSARAAVYKQINALITQKAYSPNICAPDTWDIMDKGVSGPGLTTTWGNYGNGPAVLWEDVSINNG